MRERQRVTTEDTEERGGHGGVRERGIPHFADSVRNDEIEMGAKAYGCSSCASLAAELDGELRSDDGPGEMVAVDGAAAGGEFETIDGIG